MAPARRLACERAARLAASYLDPRVASRAWRRLDPSVARAGSAGATFAREVDSPAPANARGFAAASTSGRPWSPSDASRARWSRGFATPPALADDLPAPSRLRRLRLDALRELCRSRGLDAGGRKDDLVTRLDAARASAAIDARDDADAAAQRKAEDDADDADEDAYPADAEEDAAARLGADARPSVVERILGPDEHPIRDEHLPLYVHTLARRLRSHDGKRLLLVGGAVRDLLLGRVPRDFDLLTDASWRQIKNRCKPCVVVGRRFRVAHCFSGRPGARGREMYELVSMQEHDRVRRMRAEALGETESEDDDFGDEFEDDDRDDDDAEENDDDESDDDDAENVGAKTRTRTRTRTRNRTPRSYYASDRWIARLRGNAMERDFTVNALAYDVGSRTVYDFVGALDDVDAGVVRSVVDPSRSFSEDPARMLRAVRAACRHDFRLAANVARAIRSDAHEIRRVPSARVAGELQTLLATGHAARSVRAMWELGLLEHVMHAHATYVARAVDPDTNFVAAPPGAFELEEDPEASAAFDPASEHFAPWDAKTRRRRGSALTRHKRASKRVSDATTDAVFENDPLFRVLRALDATATPSEPASDELVHAALAAPFAVKKVGWPPTTPEGGRFADAVRDAVGAAAMRAYDDAAGRSDPTDERLARRVERLAANANANAKGKDGRKRRTKTKKKIETDVREGAEGEGASDGSASLTAEERWRLGWVAWTEEAAHVARVMREDYHVPANPHATLSSAVITAHLPIVRADAIAAERDRDRDRDRGSGARFARLDAADLGGLERVLRETMRPASNGGGRGARGSSADAFFVRPDEPAAFMRILCAARGEGAPEDAMARWGATRPKARPKNSRPKKSGPKNSGPNTSGPNMSGPNTSSGPNASSGPNKSGWTTRKGRGGANGGRERRERSPRGRGSGDGTEVGSRARRDRRGEDTEYAYLADDGFDPDEPL